MLEKIIIFYPSYERGGVEIILKNLINFFLKKKIKVTLFSSGFKDEIIKKNKLFKYDEIKSSKKSLLSGRVFRATLASLNLINQLKKNSKNKSIVFSLQSSSLAILICKLFGFKVVVRNAEDPIYSIIYDNNKIKSLFSFLLKLIMYNFANGIITNSHGSKKSLDKILLLKKNLQYIYNPYLKKTKINTKFKKQNFILSVGRLTIQKNFEGLIKSFFLFSKIYKNYKLIIAGDGPLRSKLEDLSKELKINKKVIFVGWKHDLDKYYKKSKMFILNSVYEGLGNVLIDAVNYNIPIITTNCKSGPSEIVDYGKGGFIVPINSEIQLYKKMIFVEKNYSIAKAKSLYAKKRINRFLYKQNSLKYLIFIKKVFYKK